MALNVLLCALGFVIIAKGGDLFVDSSVTIARISRIPRIVIGATLVSVATTFPELVVSATASMMGDSGIAFGNAIGSAIANIGLIVGVVALITKVSVEESDFKRRSFWMAGCALLVIAFTWNLSLPRSLGIILLFIAVVYLCFDFWGIRTNKRADSSIASPEASPEANLTKPLLLFLTGTVLVFCRKPLACHLRNRHCHSDRHSLSTDWALGNCHRNLSTRTRHGNYCSA